MTVEDTMKDVIIEKVKRLDGTKDAKWIRLIHACVRGLLDDPEEREIRKAVVYED